MSRPKFPENAWFGVIADYYNLVADTTEAPEEFIWAGIVGVLSALAAASVGIPWGPQLMRPILYLCLLGETGRSRKTTSVDDARSLILEPLAPRSQQAGEPDPLEIVNGSGSGEGLIDVLADREWFPEGADKKARPNIQTGRRAVFLFDEFGALLGKAGRDQAGDLIGFMLKAFDMPQELKHSTRSRKVICTNATATIIAASTAAYLSKGLSEDLIQAGLLNRFLFVQGGRGDPLPIRPAIDAEQHRQLLGRVAAALSAVMGKPMSLSPEAVAVNDARYRLDHGRQESSDLLAAATNRTPVMAVRLSMLFAVADGTSTISGEHMTAGWDVAEYGRLVAADLVDQVHDKTWKEAEARLVSRAMRVAQTSSGTFTKTEVRDGVKGSHGMDAGTFNRIWESLIRAGDFVPVGDTGRFRVAENRGTA